MLEGANSGIASSSPTKSEKPLGKTYVGCKDLSPEMSQPMLRDINNRFNAFESKFQTDLQTCAAKQVLAKKQL